MLTVISGLSACGQKTPPPPAPPPPPVVVVPPQPQPPRGASPNFKVPVVDPYGAYQTVNSNISVAQTTWNLRSAYNVAALNCLKPEHAAIVVNYREFLQAQAKKLTAVNKALDAEFKTRYGAKFIAPREAYMTKVYNFYALPPVNSSFCDAALQVSNELRTVPTDQIDAYAARGLPAINLVFEQFFRSYDQYRVDLASWRQRYAGPQITPVLGAGIMPPTLAMQPATERLP